MKVEEFLEVLGRRRRIDILLLLYQHGELAYGAAKKMLNQRGLSCSDGTWRAGCKDFVALDLAIANHIDPLKYKYALTTQGVLIASIVEAMVRDVDILIKSNLFRKSKDAETLAIQ